MIKVTIKDGESADKLLRRFSGHIKSCKLLQKFRGLRYDVKAPTKRKVRLGAIKREQYRAAAKKKQFLA